MNPLVIDVGITGTTRMKFDGNEGFVIEHKPNEYVEREILAHNAELRSMSRNPRAHMRHVATIPKKLYWVWRREWLEKYRQYWEWKTYLAMKLNSRDYSFLRTGGGRL